MRFDRAVVIAGLVLAASGSAPPAGAARPECLSAVNGLMVEYDIPPTREVFGLPPDLAPPSAGGKGKEAPAVPVRPMGSPPAKAAPKQPIQPRAKLPEAQRKRLETTLQDARLAEARGDEAQCMQLLGRAREIVKTAR